MRDEPILRKTEWTEGQTKYVMRVYGGLHYTKGNSAPHFSLTMFQWRNGREDSCGAAHDDILAKFPELADLAAMHLSDVSGQPTHAESNGWFWLAGAMGGAGERYHGGNGMPKRSETECLDIFAKHCRISGNEAAVLFEDVRACWNYPDMRARWKELCSGMTARWQQEAKACIAKHGLVVYGDPWEAAA